MKIIKNKTKLSAKRLNLTRMKRHVELCQYCMRESISWWDVEKDGYEITCQHCGRLILLCDTCLHSDDNVSQKCDWCEEECFRKK